MGPREGLDPQFPGTAIHRIRVRLSVRFGVRVSSKRISREHRKGNSQPQTIWGNLVRNFMQFHALTLTLNSTLTLTLTPNPNPTPGYGEPWEW